MTKVSNF